MKEYIGIIKEFIYKYRNYFLAFVLFVVMIVAVGAANRKDSDVQMSELDLTNENGEIENFEIDAHADINDLINRYFKAYSESDVEELSKFVRPLTKTEQSYIQIYSKFVEDYDNIVCYTKSGLSDGEYIVSVYLERKFVGAERLAPGLDFFYVETDADGNLFIDNVYSQFNQSNHEENTDPEVEALIGEFENSDDMAKLKAEAQTRFEKAISEDGNLKTAIEETVPEAIAEWANEIAKLAREQKEEEAEAAQDTGDEKENENGESTVEESDGTDTKDTDTEVDETDDTDTEDTDVKDTDAKDTDAKDTDEGESDTDKSSADDDETPVNVSEGTVKMYTIDNIKLRKKPNTDADVITVIEMGKKLTAYMDTLDDDGWIKVKYGKKKGYVKREYLVRKKSSIPADVRAEMNNTSSESDTSSASNDNAGEAGTNAAGVIVLPEGKSITLSQSVNLRKQMSEDGELMATVDAGDTVKIVMSYAEGWTKVEWGEKIGYMRSDLIK